MLCYSAMISSTFIVTVAVAIISIYIFKAFLSDPAPYGKVCNLDFFQRNGTRIDK